MSVGKDFSKADKGRKFSKGGEMKHEDVKMDKAMMQKAVNKHESRLHKGQPMTKLAKGGYIRAADGCAQRGKTKGTMVSMSGGKVLGTKVAAGNGMAKGGMAKGKC